MYKKNIQLAALLMMMLFALTNLTGCNLIKKRDKVTNIENYDRTKIKIFWQNEKSQPEKVDEAIIAKIEQENNVEIEFETPPSTNYMERLQIMLAGGDYPDVIQFNSQNDKVYFDALNNGVIIPINEYLKSADNLKKHTYEISWKSLMTKQDGKIYGVPRTSPIRADGYIVRKDWLDNVGLALPEDGLVTLDEFTEILRRFTFNDPDKNGKKDTYGYAGHLNAMGNIEPFLLSPFGVNGWQESNGEHAYMDPRYDKADRRYKEALQYAATLYKTGVMDSDSVINKRDIANQRFKQGIDGVFYEFVGWMHGREGEMQKNNPNVKLAYISGIKDKNGNVVCGVPGTGSWGFYSITEKAKNPQKIIDMFDWMLSDEGWDIVKYGIENTSYTMENGKRKLLEAGKGTWGNRFMRRSDDPEFFIPLNVPEEIKPEIGSIIEKCMKQSILTKDLGYRPEISNTSAYIDYQETMNKGIARIVVGDLPVSEYDRLLDGWYKAGGEEYIRQMNDYIKKIEAEASLK